MAGVGMRLRRALPEGVKRPLRQWRGDRHEARVAALERRVNDWAGVTSHARVVYDVLGRQVAALESRVAELEDAVQAPPIAPGDDAARREARELVEEVRREHARVRSALSLASIQEERVRRLESAVHEAVRAGWVQAPADPHRPPVEVDAAILDPASVNARRSARTR